jgi:predicted ester cyclase
MSRLFGLALLLAVVASPLLMRGATAQDATPCPPLTEEEAAQWVTDYYTDWNGHDAAAIAARYVDGAIKHWGIGVDAQGIDEITKSVQGYFDAFPQLHTTVDRVWVTDDAIVVRFISIGIQEIEYMGIPASRETATWTGIHIFQVDCGKIVESWHEADHFGRIEQQGVIPVASPEATPSA